MQGKPYKFQLKSSEDLYKTFEMIHTLYITLFSQYQQKKVIPPVMLFILYIWNKQCLRNVA